MKKASAKVVSVLLAVTLLCNFSLIYSFGYVSANTTSTSVGYEVSGDLTYSFDLNGVDEPVADYAIIISVLVANYIGTEENSELVKSIQYYIDLGYMINLEETLGEISVNTIKAAFDANQDFNTCVNDLGFSGKLDDVIKSYEDNETGLNKFFEVFSTCTSSDLALSTYKNDDIYVISGASQNVDSTLKFSLFDDELLMADIYGENSSGDIIYAGSNIKTAVENSSVKIVIVNNRVDLSSDISVNEDKEIQNVDLLSFGSYKFAITSDNLTLTTDYDVLSSIKTSSDYDIINDVVSGKYTYVISYITPEVVKVEVAVPEDSETIKGVSMSEENQFIVIDVSPSGITAEEFLACVDSEGKVGEVERYITNADGEAVDVVGTGTVLIVTDVNTSTGEVSVKEYTVVVLGDVNGDSKSNSGDLVIITNYYMGELELEDIYLQAADINQDNNINSGDLVKIVNKFISQWDDDTYQSELSI